ncbi:MAG TPA: PAS domain S-box protein [Cyclobacteriaceae bacterium]|nr:PAS domain S-box protein [Cyclobacteriaceae bacterium]
MSNSVGLTHRSNVVHMLDKLPAVVFEYSVFPDGTRDFTYISPRCEEILGVSKDVLMRGILPMKNFIYHEDWTHFQETTEDSLSSLREWKWEGRLNSRGQVVWIEACGMPTRMPDGVIVCHGIISDVTQRKVLEQRHRESDKKYRELVEHIPLGIGIHAEGKLVYANRYALEMMGATKPEDLIGKSVLDLVHPEYKDVVRERMKLVMQGIEVPAIEQKYVRLDGKTIDVETAAYPFSHHGIPAVQLIVKDVTDKKQALESMRKTETLFTQLFQNSPMAIVILDDKGNVVQINQGFHEMFGYSIDELKGKGLNAFIVPEELEAEGNDLNSLISSYKVIRIETARRRRDGEMLSLIVYGVPVHMEDKTIGIFGVYVDITEQKKIEKELKVRNTELDNFVYKVSHDLRAPLSSILGLVNLANMPGNDDNPGTYIELIGRKVEQLDHFISDVLSHSKNLKQSVTIEKVDVKQIVANTFTDLSYLRNADLIFKEIDIQGSEFYSDRWRLAEIFRNLISNAIKYRRMDIDRPTVKVTVRINEVEADISFSDNGIGIEPDKLLNIFEMFYRASTQSDGSGLGLYIVKNAVEKLGGQIDVFSRPLQGTEFKIILPNQKP